MRDVMNNSGVIRDGLLENLAILEQAARFDPKASIEFMRRARISPSVLNPRADGPQPFGAARSPHQAAYFRKTFCVDESSGEAKSGSGASIWMGPG